MEQKPFSITRAFIEKSAKRAAKEATRIERNFLYQHKKAKFMGLYYLKSGGMARGHSTYLVEGRCIRNGKCRCHKSGGHRYHIPPYCCLKCRSELLIKKISRNNSRIKKKRLSRMLITIS